MLFPKRRTEPRSTVVDSWLRWEGFAAYPEARAAIDEILSVPFIRPSIDRGTIEDQLGRHLAALGEAPRPVRWFDTFVGAHDYLSNEVLCTRAAKRAPESAEKDAAESLARAEEDYDLDPGDYRVRHWNPSGLMTSRSWLRARLAAHRAAENAARLMEQQVESGIRPWAESGVGGMLGSRLLDLDARDAAWSAACLSASPHFSLSKTKGQEWFSARRMTALSAENAYKWAQRSSYFELAANPGAEADAASAAGRAAYTAVRRAFAAGLWAFWVRDEEIVAVPAPDLHIDERCQLHRLEGPAVEWPGETYWFTEGGKANRVPVASFEKIQRRELLNGMALGAIACFLLIMVVRDSFPALF
jgi:hypothetical protein